MKINGFHLKTTEMHRFLEVFRSTELQIHRNTISQARHISYYLLKKYIYKKIDSENILEGVIQVILTRNCSQIGLAAMLITIGFPIRTENTLLAAK